MRKVYLDETETTMCMGVFVHDAEVIPAGATISSMSVKHKNREYQRYADEYDIHFIFDDNVPELDFYTIPQVDIFATDSSGGFIGSLGQVADMGSNASICYINRDKKIFLIAKDGRTFLRDVEQWKNLLTPCTDVEFFTSKEAAKSKYEFIDRDAMEQSLNAVGFETVKNLKY